MIVSGMGLSGGNTLGDFQLYTAVQAPVFGGVAAGQRLEFTIAGRRQTSRRHALRYQKPNN